MKLLVLDGNSIINRAYYGVRPLTTKDGFFTNAIYGFLTMFHKIYTDTQPDGVAVAFDRKAPTFRHLKYADYKGKRKGMPPELAMQLQPLQELLAAMGLRLLSADGWEADDILGTLAEACRLNPDDSCVIATGDRDTLQLVGDGVVVRMLTTRQGKAEAVLYDERKILEDYGVKPVQLIEVKAIQGDTSDNIPGVPGIGEKGALDLVSRFGSLDYIYSHIDEIDVKPGIRKKLIEGRESAYLSRWLGTVATNAPVPTDLGEYVPQPPDAEKVTELMLRFELFRSLEKMKKEWFRDAPPPSPAAAPADHADAAASTDVIFCRDTDALISQIREDGKAYFLLPEDPEQICVARQGNVVVVTGQDVERFCREILADDAIEKFTFDLKTTLHVLAPWGIVPRRVVCDVMLGAYVLNPSSDCESLEKLAAQYASVLPDSIPSGLKTALLCQRLPAMCGRIMAEIERNRQLPLLSDVEIPLAYVLADMETAGFAADAHALDEFEKRLSLRVNELTAKIYALAGEEFNINSPKQIGAVLFEKMKRPGGKKTKTGYSTNAEVLERLAADNEIVALILEYRTLTKLTSTYCQGLKKAIAADGRIHTTFRQTETRTGRISSVEPNLQNIPVRTELGSELRRFFRAGEGMTLVDADYSQIELRVLADMAGDEIMTQAFRDGTDIHAVTASQVFGIPLAEVTPRMRSNAKAVNFGIVYGISAFSLAKDIGVSNAEAAAYINSYMRKYSAIADYMKKLVEQAKATGYAETMFGRRRYLPELTASNFQTRSFGERVARNMPIQGTAADIIKKAMIAVHQRLRAEGMRSRLILQIHDELILECPLDESVKATEILRQEMESAVSLSVPLTVDAHAGDSWFDAKG